MGVGFLHGQTGGGKKSVIKSIQSGTISIAVGTKTNTATISSVDLSKAAIIHNGSRGGTNSSTESALNRVNVTLTLTNSTTLTANSYINVTTTATIVSYTIVEFDNIKSIQRGSISIPSGISGTATVTAVDMSKSILLHNGFFTAAANNAQRAFHTLVLTNSTTITAERTSTAASDATVNYSLIEFN